MLKKILALGVTSAVLAGCHTTMPNLSTASAPATKTVTTENVATSPAVVEVQKKESISADGTVYQSVTNNEEFKYTIGFELFNVDGDMFNLYSSGHYTRKLSYERGGYELSGSWTFEDGKWCLLGDNNGCYTWERASTGDHYRVTSVDSGVSQLYYYQK